MRDDIVYEWEKLEVYGWTNKFARVVGRLLADVPSRHRVHVHNLIGQAIVMSNAVAGANKDIAPGEPPLSIEHRRAWLMIGYTAARGAAETLGTIRKVHERSIGNLIDGMELIVKIAEAFATDLELLDGSTRTTKPIMHLA